LNIFDSSLNNGYDISEFIDGFLDFLRSLLFYSIKGNTPEDEYADSYKSLLNKYSQGDIMRISEITALTQKELHYSSFRRFAAERLLVKVANIDKTVTISQLLDFFKKSEGGTSNSGESDKSSNFGDKTNPRAINSDVHVKEIEEVKHVDINSTDKIETLEEKKEKPQSDKTKIKESMKNILQNQPIIDYIKEKFNGNFID
jgi:hypothetical protein